ncbi:MAG: TIGR04076 family protein [Bacteroidales bacterium]|nr:MAG: TIGR04076 family protein [Bacteroidales bacterium]
MNLIIKVKEIKGHCPVFSRGDKFMLEDGYKLVSDIPVCMHALSSIMPFYNALRVSDPAKFGIAGKDNADAGFVQCPDVCDYTKGGTAILEISREE